MRAVRAAATGGRGGQRMHLPCIVVLLAATGLAASSCQETTEKPQPAMRAAAVPRGTIKGHVRLEAHLRETRSAASRRSYEQALAEMRSSDYVLFKEERRLLR